MEILKRFAHQQKISHEEFIEALHITIEHEREACACIAIATASQYSEGSQVYLVAKSIAAAIRSQI